MNAPAIITPDALQQARTMPDLLNRFYNYMDVQTITAKSYMVCLSSFMAWIKDNAITQPTRADIIAYKEYLNTPHRRRQRADRESNSPAPVIHFSTATQARYLRAVKMFFKWTAAEGLYPNISDNIKGAKVQAKDSRDALQKEDATALLKSIDQSTDTGKRDYAMILLSITAGLRIVEMQRANIGNIETLGGEHVLYIQGKGHTEADTYKKLTPEVYAAIMAYLKTRRTKDSAAPLFAGIGNRSREQRLTEPSISRIIKDRLKAAGYDTHRISAHSLRHTSITFLLKAGATIQEAQHHARHASPETTGIYAHNIDKAEQHTEQTIYNYLFDVETDAPTQAADIIKRMPTAQQRRVIDLLRTMSASPTF